MTKVPSLLGQNHVARRIQLQTDLRYSELQHKYSKMTTRCLRPCGPTRGYLLKGADQAEVLQVIKAVASGEAIFSSAIAVRLIASSPHLRRPRRHKPSPS
jgi:DNA-binding NarL/FixJ family response regulator